MKPLIIGIGNAYRGDDGAGLVAARRIREIAGDAIHVLEMSGEGASLIEAWQEQEFVILIDAVHSGAAPGTIHRLDARTQPLPSRFFHYSTHAFSVAEAVEMARALDRLPPRLIALGIEGKEFGSSESLSPEVEAAMEALVRRVLAEVPPNAD